MAIDFRADHERLAQLEARGLGDDVSIWKYSDYLVGTIEEYGEQYVPRFLDEFEKVKSAALTAIETTDDIEGMLEIYWQAVRHLAPWRFEDFMLYMEKNRPFKKRFYAPRKNTLHIVAEDLQALEDGKYEFYGLSLPPRVGKALADDTPILTADGWKRHGDLCVGDRVIGADGKFKRVLAVHPKCEMQYEVEFTNGEKLVCHGEHQFYVRNRHRLKDELMSVKDMANDYENDLVGRGHRYHYMLIEKQPIEGERKDLPVQPYTFGVWLGDGRNGNPDICGSREDCEVMKPSIFAEGYSLAWETTHKGTGVYYYGVRGLRQDLQTIGLCHSRKRCDKYIPDEYLTASKEQRLELLAGLIDTDGCLRAKEHRYDFVTTEATLRDSYIRLVSTFGWRCCVQEIAPSVSSSGIKGKHTYWCISFNPTEYIPCRLERKRLRTYSKQRRVAIKSIKPCEGVVGNCITVEDGMYLAGHTMLPTHNSTISCFFMAWIIGKRPASHNAMGAHSEILASNFYSEVLTLTTSADYTFSEIFPGVKLKRKQGKPDMTLDYGTGDNFATFTCRGIDGTWTGAVDVSHDGYLYTDDLIRDRQESLSAQRLNKRYQDYLNVMKDRKNDGARELMIGTRWNVIDPLGRIEEQFGDDPRYFFRRIPALDENDESNFKYAVKGFSTEYYHDMRAMLDPNEWQAKYMQRPFVREGLLFPEDELRYFNGVLPAGGFKRVVSACDVAFGGGDSLSMPIGYEYENGDVYIVDWVFNSGAKEVTIPLVAGKILENEIQQIRFEANNGGDIYANYIDEELKKHRYPCAITHRRASTKTAKFEKVIQCAGDIKRRFIFLADNVTIRKASGEDTAQTKRYYRSQEYTKAMDELLMYVQIGKNEHDDAADSLAQLVQTIGGSVDVEVQVMRRFF